MRCWRRLLKSPLDARRSNQSILKEINPECSLKERMLKLKFQYFGHLMRRADSLVPTLLMRKIEGRRRGRQKMRRLDSITDSMNMNRSKLQETVKEAEGYIFVFPSTSLHKAPAVPEPRLNQAREQRSICAAHRVSMWDRLLLWGNQPCVLCPVASPWVLGLGRKRKWGQTCSNHVHEKQKARLRANM